MSSSATSIDPPLNQGWGYGITLGFGLAFAAGMIQITHLLKKYNHENNKHFETFATAGRHIGTGLTATAVISSWAWSTALLSSSVVTWNYGVAGAYAFASGCLVQIAFFALLAIQSKLKTPHAHTILEVVKTRYGTVAHFVYMFFCLATNIIAVSNMLLGASAAVSALTGMHVVAATFLLPVGVVLYTITGGLKATFVTDWMHTVALLIILIYLSIKTLQNESIGSIRHLYNVIVEVGQKTPVVGNRDGSYLTMASKGATEFLIIHTLGNFGLVILDSSYWQKAYSADISSAVPGYIIGGILYFSLPWCLGTISGLAGLALAYQNAPSWPVQGRPLSAAELNAGLVLPYAASAVAGKAGSVAVVIIIFMAVTSTTSAQLVAVSSILSSDVYHTYINPRATEKQIIRVSAWSCVGFGIFMAAFSVMLYYVNISLTWTLYFLGIITCPAMVTLPLTVLWKKQTWAAAVISPIIGLFAAIAVWISTAWYYGGGAISVTTTGQVLPNVWGNVAAAFVPAILSPLISFIFPEPDFLWEHFNEIKLIKADRSATSSIAEDASTEEKADAKREEIEAHVLNNTTLTEAQVAFMKRQSKIAAAIGVFLFLAVWVLWPFIMYAAEYVFSPEFFTGWIVVALIWAFVTALVVTILPPLEGRHVIAKVVGGVIGPKPAKPSDGP